MNRILSNPIVSNRILYQPYRVSRYRYLSLLHRTYRVYVLASQMASRRAGRGVQHRPVTCGVLTQHALWQEDRLKLQKIVKEKIAKVKAMLEIDSEDVEEGYAELERYFKQLLVAHTKCQMLLDRDEPKFADLVEKLDKSVHLIKRKIIERSSNGSVGTRSQQKATESRTQQNSTEPRSHQETAEPRTPQEQVEPRKPESEAVHRQDNLSKVLT